MKKLIFPAVIALSIGLLAVNAAGPTYGASAPFFGGKNTYGYSWAGWDGKTCSITTLIGKVYGQ